VRPSPFYLLAGVVSQPVKWLYRLRVEGEENIPESGGFVLAANHLSNFDPWPLALPLFPKRYLRFMAKSELFWWPLGPIISAGGAFKVRRGQGDIEAVKKAVDLVRKGHVVVMFPEGTRQRKGLVKKYRPGAHTGAARIALEAGAPLVPAAIKGTDRLTRLGPLHVRYGKPLDLDGLDPRTATDKLMVELERLGEGL
jgi:1-acyl-sn-glycerol-3-phosphate acyltransferase